MASIEKATLTPEETFRTGLIIGKLLKEGDVISLEGEMGAGKTLLARGISEGAGVSEADWSGSPTFIIAQHYRAGKKNLIHMDFYRIASQNELNEIGTEDLLGEGRISMIEWGDKFPYSLPRGALRVKIKKTSISARLITFEADEEPGRRIIEQMEMTEAGEK